MLHEIPRYFNPYFSTLIQTNPSADRPPPFQSSVQSGFAESTNGKPMRIASSANFVDYGPITPTNPIIRKISVSVDPGSSQGYQLLSSANHPLKLDDNIIPDTTCDNGACSEKIAAPFLNPFTFGLGFSLDGVNYRQLADRSKEEPMTAMPMGDLTIKLNVSQNQPLPKDKHYENTLIFLAIPKY
ncbi:hypothetical protein HYT17_03560 [Candidatus Microgenomates bacterium]|nr:hypothetical protein [Candidatus Microgenomates bacterium]